MKATHIGECQICGRNQKLPSDRLSNHGYTVQWGFFSGICPGSGYLPFEVDTSRIDGAVASAELRIAELKQQSAHILARTDNQGFYHNYEGNGYVWREVEFSEQPNKYVEGHLDVVFQVINPPAPSFHANKYAPFKYPKLAYQSGFYTHGLSNIAAESRQRYCKNHLQKQIEQLSGYVSWQKKRLIDWAPKPLKALKAVTAKGEF